MSKKLLLLILLLLPAATTSYAAENDVTVVSENASGQKIERTLNITPFAATVLDDASATTLRATTGTNDAANLTTGSLPDGRVDALKGKLVFVDSVNGSDSTGARGTLKPFLTLAAAKAAAQSGDTIIVGPGTYNESITLANGVNFYFAPGAVVSTSAANIITDNGVAVVAEILGYGKFIGVRSGASDPITGLRVSNASSQITFEAQSVSVTNNTANVFIEINCFTVSAGTLKATIAGDMSANGSGSKHGLMQTGSSTVVLDVRGSAGVMSLSGLGTQTVRIRESGGEIRHTGSGNQYISARNLSTIQGSGTGNQYIEADVIDGSGSTHSIYWNASTATDSWIKAKQIIGPISLKTTGANIHWYIKAQLLESASTAYAAIDCHTPTSTASWVQIEKIVNTGNQDTIKVASGKLYINTQKIEAGVQKAFNVTGANALFYLNAQKVEGSNNTIANGTSWLDILEFNDVNGAGGPQVTVSGGTAYLRALSMRRTTAGDGVVVSGGVLYLSGAIDTSTSNTSNPINKSGGTLILQNVALVAESTRDSIEAATAQNVKVYGTSVTNKAVDANVTIQVGTLTVDAAVN